MGLTSEGIVMAKEIIRINATFIHLEDDDVWLDDVHEDIETIGGFMFEKYIKCKTLASALNELSFTRGPVILVVDLKINSDFPGLDWLIRELVSNQFFRSELFVFVISGQLNAALKHALVQSGMREEFIFDKGYWNDKRHDFLSELSKIQIKINERVRTENLAYPRHDEHVDGFILSAFTELEGMTGEKSAEKASSNYFPELPMLLQISDLSWDPKEIPDYKEVSRIGDIVACIGSIRTARALEADKKVLSIDGGRPSVSANSEETEENSPLDRMGIMPIHEAGEKGDNCLIGIIDTEINLLHDTFLTQDKNKTRIVAIWDQTDSAGPSPSPNLYNQTEYSNSTVQQGTIYLEDEINRFIKEGQIPLGLQKNNPHGTQVASIAGGQQTISFSGGVAPEAKLVIVIPDLKLGTGDLVNRGYTLNLGYSISHIAALNFIKSIAEQENLPYCINVSLGTNGGAHDGSSLLERAFDNLTIGGRSPGGAITKSAGNDRQKELHARVTMLSNSEEELPFIIEGSIRDPITIELWFDSADEYKFTIIDPGRVPTESISVIYPERRGSFSSGNHYYAKYTEFHKDNGDGQLLITLWPGKNNYINFGDWTIVIDSLKISSGEINAWLEVTDVDAVGFTDHQDQNITISVPGTARSVITVGSIRNQDKLRLSQFSAYGPSRQNKDGIIYKPDVVAIGEGILAANSFSNGVVKTKGTSVAAPYVTGAIALFYSYWQKQEGKVRHWEQKNANQIRSLLRQSCINYSAEWDRGMGYGVFHCENFFELFGYDKSTARTKGKNK